MAANNGLQARYAEVARLLTGRSNASAEDGIRWIRALTADLSIPGLAAYGLSENHIPDLCEKALRASSMQGNPVSFNSTTLASILRAAL